MNEYLDVFEVEVGQNNRGVWYVKSLKVVKHDSITLTGIIDELMSKLDSILRRHNVEKKEG